MFYDIEDGWWCVLGYIQPPVGGSQKRCGAGHAVQDLRCRTCDAECARVTNRTSASKTTPSTYIWLHLFGFFVTHTPVFIRNCRLHRYFLYGGLGGHGGTMVRACR